MCQAVMCECMCEAVRRVCVYARECVVYECVWCDMCECVCVRLCVCENMCVRVSVRLCVVVSVTVMCEYL